MLWGMHSPLGPRSTDPGETVSEPNGSDVDVRSGIGCFDHLAIAQVHCFMLIAVDSVEEDVTGLYVRQRDPNGVGELSSRVVGQVDTGGGVGQHH